MADLLTFLGLLLIVEGLPWFLSPLRVKALMRLLLAVPEASLRLLGLVWMLLGLLLVYLARG
ncbi:DUF2065 family protein [Desulfuromonas sp. CSMB_57]|jgi:uncharacterized protein YjeT (DUF2065 family)|uniref:DUF2065 family protein n=1 Tax=Desulfuromonas sp. CSMB_57 TaxID=2807629 RepID=UPI001CD5B30D|nr:DUF2065 family protein [Desulfuromonas sp. CSMB_57]